MAQVYSFPFDTWNRLMGPFVETNGTTLVPGFGPSHHHTVGCNGPSLVQKGFCSDSDSGENKISPMLYHLTSPILCITRSRLLFFVFPYDSCCTGDGSLLACGLCRTFNVTWIVVIVILTCPHCPLSAPNGSVDIFLLFNRGSDSHPGGYSFLP